MAVQARPVLGRVLGGKRILLIGYRNSRCRGVPKDGLVAELDWIDDVREST